MPACRPRAAGPAEVLPPLAPDGAGAAPDAPDAPDAPPAAPADVAGAPPGGDAAGADLPAATVPPVAAADALRFTFSPLVLDVYRDTEVRVQVTSVPAALQAQAPTFEWLFDDGSRPLTGPAVSHLVQGGMRDARVTLRVLVAGAVVATQTASIPLERLPVVPLPGSAEPAPPDDLPPPPAPGETSFRLAVISDSNGPYGTETQGTSVTTAVRSLVERVRPDLVVHNGDMVAGQRRGFTDEHIGRMWAGYHRAVSEPLRLVGLPLVPVAGNHDAAPGLPDRRHFVAEWRAPERVPAVDFVDGSNYPLAYSFVFRGAFFVVMDGATGHVSEADIRWLRRQLRQANIFPLRFVFSHLPLHRFTERSFGDLAGPNEAGGRPMAGAADGASLELEKNFRLYNLFVEQNVTLLFSGHYEVFYKGRYGALRVVSTGNLAGTGRSLAGHDASQPPSYVVVDVAAGTLARVFGVRGPDFTRVFDERSLPAAVEVYRYDPF